MRRAARTATTLAIIAVVWGVAAAASLWVAFGTALGPVVWVIDQRHAEGVHVGDLVAVAVFGGLALVATVRLLRRWRQPRH